VKLDAIKAILCNLRMLHRQVAHMTYDYA